MPAGWWFDERAHAGEEHLEPAEAARYDERMPFDPAEEVARCRELGLDGTIVEFGSGTGSFAVAIAPHCDRVVAVDPSEAMLEIAREKCEDAGISNVDLVHDGFLSYRHRADPPSAVFSKDALHHLPDFWKIEALKRIGEVLAPGGIFRLRDFVYSFDPAESHEAIDAWLDAHRRTTSFTDEELDRHVRDEFGTYGFLLEAMIERVGFEILETEYEDGIYATYTCRWPETKDRDA